MHRTLVDDTMLINQKHMKDLIKGIKELLPLSIDRYKMSRILADVYKTKPGTQLI